jgi:hypothetical protein
MTHIERTNGQCERVLSPCHVSSLLHSRRLDHFSSRTISSLWSVSSLPPARPPCLPSDAWIPSPTTSTNTTRHHSYLSSRRDRDQEKPSLSTYVRLLSSLSPADTTTFSVYSTAPPPSQPPNPRISMLSLNILPPLSTIA